MESNEFERLRVELERTKDQLARAQGLITLGHLSAQSIHRLNSCLAVIGGYAQLLLEREDLEEGLRATIQKIDLETEKAAEIIRKLGDLAKEARVGPPGEG